METNRNLERHSRHSLTEEFTDTLKLATQYLTPRAFRPERALNAAITDALLVGLAKRLKTGPIQTPEKIQQAYKRLLSDPKFTERYKTGTTDETSIRGRISSAFEEFEKVK